MAKTTYYYDNITKLYNFADELEQGRRLHITRLMPIFRLVDSYEEMRDFFIFLLGGILEFPRKSVNNFLVMPHDYKLQVTSFLKVFLKTPNQNDYLRILIYYQQVNQYIDGLKRVYVHASRWRCADADVLMLHHITWAIQRAKLGAYGCEFDWSCYVVAQAYCCDYADLRFIPDKKSAIRVRQVASYFAQKHNLNSKSLDRRS